MRHAILVLLLVLAACASSAKSKKRRGGHGKQATIVLNGVKTDVTWSDGDSFKIHSGEYDGHGTRLMGFNTLEAYGPVHRWGSWTGKELFKLAKSCTDVAASQEWQCTTDGKKDGYKRLLINCPDLTVEMVRQGQALAFAVDEDESPPAVQAAQADAMREGRGMWAKGTVKAVVTSLHSVGEDGRTEPQAYNRVVDTRTGKAAKLPHSDTYQTCQEVCVEVEGDTSCMVYVPFNIRYRNKPDCLR